MAKKRQKSVFGLALGNMALMVSLNAKLNACVGKYLPHDSPASAQAKHARHACPSSCECTGL